MSKYYNKSVRWDVYKSQEALLDIYPQDNKLAIFSLNTPEIILQLIVFC